MSDDKSFDSYFKKEKIKSSNGISSDVQQKDSADFNKKHMFEQCEFFNHFLTYRRRMARMASMQALYLYEIKKKFSLEMLSDEDLFIQKNKLQINTNDLCREVIFFYKKVFFTPKEYGDTKKNTKIDENFLFTVVDKAINNLSKIDVLIQRYLNKNWTVSKLDIVVKSLIRCAIAEILLGYKTEKAVLCSEYTNLASNFLNVKEIGFINGILDKLYVSIIV